MGNKSQQACFNLPSQKTIMLNKPSHCQITVNQNIKTHTKHPQQSKSSNKINSQNCIQSVEKAIIKESNHQKYPLQQDKLKKKKENMITEEFLQNGNPMIFSIIKDCSQQPLSCSEEQKGQLENKIFSIKESVQTLNSLKTNSIKIIKNQQQSDSLSSISLSQFNLPLETIVFESIKSQQTQNQKPKKERRAQKSNKSIQKGIEGKVVLKQVMPKNEQKIQHTFEKKPKNVNEIKKDTKSIQKKSQRLVPASLQKIGDFKQKNSSI